MGGTSAGGHVFGSVCVCGGGGGRGGGSQLTPTEERKEGAISYPFPKRAHTPRST